VVVKAESEVRVSGVGRIAVRSYSNRCVRGRGDERKRDGESDGGLGVIGCVFVFICWDISFLFFTIAILCLR
jgi:hypothetical protein